MSAPGQMRGHVIICLVADNQNVAHRVMPEIGRGRFGTLMADVDTHFRHDQHCKRMHLLLGSGASALYIELIALKLSKKSFGHLAAALVASAQDQNKRFVSRHGFYAPCGMGRYWSMFSMKWRISSRTRR